MFLGKNVCIEHVGSTAIPNMVGKNIEVLRKKRGIKQKDFIARVQVLGCDMNPTSYSKLEGQVRSATDKEIIKIMLGK